MLMFLHADWLFLHADWLALHADWLVLHDIGAVHVCLELILLVILLNTVYLSINVMHVLHMLVVHTTHVYILYIFCMHKLARR